jgi:hypothetical protein
MKNEQSATTTRLYSPRAILYALGIKLRSLKFFDTIAAHLHIRQKTIHHTPIEKLTDAFIAILAGAHGLCEINTRVRTDTALQRAFGRSSCAEQSVVQETLNACTSKNIAEMKRAFKALLQKHGRAYCHPYQERLQLLDVDMTGLPCAAKRKKPARGTLLTIHIAMADRWRASLPLIMRRSSRTACCPVMFSSIKCSGHLSKRWK